MTSLRSLLAAVFSLTLVVHSAAAEPDPHRQIDNRLLSIELESLMDIYGEVFREMEMMRVHRAQVEAELEGDGSEDVAREIRKIERRVHHLDRRLQELREDLHARADRLQARQRRHPEAMERRGRMQRERMEPMWREPELHEPERRERMESERHQPEAMERRERMERERMERMQGARERRERRVRQPFMEERDEEEDWEMEHDIPVSDVPKRVMDAARRAAEGIDFTEAEIVITPRRTFYELEGQTDDAEVEVMVSADGRQVEVEIEEHRNEE